MNFEIKLTKIKLRELMYDSHMQRCIKFRWKRVTCITCYYSNLISGVCESVSTCSVSLTGSCVVNKDLRIDNSTEINGAFI